MKTIFIISCFTFLFSEVYSEIGGYCSSKVVANSSGLIGPNYQDYNTVYNGLPSCITLINEDGLCCYLKAKFKNKDADEKYTHKGCVRVSESDYSNIDTLISNLEGYITASGNLENVNVDIDCNSKYIKLAGLALLAFLP